MDSKPCFPRGSNSLLSFVTVGDAFALWLVYWTLDRMTRFMHWPGNFVVFLSRTLKLLKCVSSPGSSGRLFGQLDKMIKGSLRWTSLQSRDSSSTHSYGSLGQFVLSAT